MVAKNANAMNLNAVSGICTWDGTSVQSTQALNQYNVLTGGASANSFNQIAPSTAGQLFTSAGASSQPTWTTSTYPGTNAVNTLLYASSANVMGALATANNGILITSASGVPSWLADGTTGQILLATTGSPPTWASISSLGTGFIKILTLTASNSASLAFTSSNITSTYTAYLIVFNNIISASNAVNFNMDWSVNNGSGYLNSNYNSGNTYRSWNSATWANANSTSTCPLVANSDQSSTFPTSGQIFVYNVGTSQYTSALGELIGGCNTLTNVMYSQTTTVTINNIKFSMSSGNITSGTITLYGIVQ